MNDSLPTPKEVHYLADYKQSDFSVNKAELDFALFDNHSVVTTKVSYKKVNSSASQLVLSGVGLELLSVYLNGELCKSYDQSRTELIIRNVPEHFVLTTQVKIHPKKNTLLEGLYCSNNLFCTQCEPEGFRRITYFLDRPDVMTCYHVRIEADKTKYPILLSNGNLVGSGNIDNGRHYAKWYDPFKKPSYLFALVAGDLSVVEKVYQTKDNRDVLLQVFAEKKYQNQSQYALDALERSMKWDEDTFNLIYDLERYMVVSIDDFNMGAMENKGLNIFNSKYVLANTATATDKDFLNIENIIGHEYFHNWTGNRVTCRDWFQLSLKEGLTVFRDALFSADMTTKGIKRLEEVKTVREHQFIEDMGPTSHPVRPESYIEMNNFYTLTIYEKGAEIIRMMYNLVGEVKFKQGVALYFERHDGQAVTVEDFAQAMSDASGFDFMGQFFNWYTQSGVPTVTVVSEFDHSGNRFKLHFSQDYSAMKDNIERQPVIIPIVYKLFDKDGERLSSENKVILDGHQKTIEFGSINSPVVVSLLRNFSAPVILNYEQDLSERHLLVKYDDDLFVRFDALQNILKLLVKAQLTQQNNLSSQMDELINTLNHLIQDDLTPISEKAELLTFPSLSVFFEWFSPIDVDDLNLAVNKLKQAIAEVLKDKLVDIVNKESSYAEDDLSFDAMSERKLKTIAWQWLSVLIAQHKDRSLLTLAYQQFESTKSMTNRLAGLSALNTADCDERKTAFNDFYQEFSAFPQVIDKWFALYAQRHDESIMNDILKLSEHGDFVITNPNRVRALYSSFCTQNFENFHHHSGKGYQLLSNFLIKLDNINPSIASNMVKPLIHWRKFDENRQEKMYAELVKISKKENLSKDLYEIVDKAIHSKQND